MFVDVGRIVSNALPRSKRVAIFQVINKRENRVSAYQCVTLRSDPSIVRLGSVFIEIRFPLL